MLDSTTSQKSPQFYKSIKSKQELQSFYHYSKIVKLKELTQKPTQISINYNLSQHNSIGLRQSDHISNFEFFIQQNSRHNYHRQIREQYQYHSQSALTKNQTEKINWQKHKENQKRIEQAINKYKFNHSLENNQQSITRRRIQRLSSETSTQSKFFIESRPTSKLGTQLQNQILIDSIQKKQSIKAVSTQHQSQIDQHDCEISPKNLNFEDLVNKILVKQQEQQQESSNQELNQEEEEEEFEDQKSEKEIIQKTEGIYEQIEKQLDNNLRRQLSKNLQKQDNKIYEQPKTINKQTTQKLQQTKKKLKAQIQQQLQVQDVQSDTNTQQQQKQQSDFEQSNTNSPLKTHNEKKQENKDEYIKQLRDEQIMYKQNQILQQKEDEKRQEAKLQEIQQIQDEIERKKNKKEEFVYNYQENDNEEQFIKKQSQLKLDLIEQQRKQQEKLLRQEQLQKEKEEEEKQKEIEEIKKKEIAQLIQKQKDEIDKQIQEELVKQPPKLQKQTSVLIAPKQIFQERKRTQEEIETSNRQIQKEIETKIQKQKEDDEKEELEKLNFVDYMLRSQNVYEVNYDKFKLYEDKLKKIKEAPNYLDVDELDIYNFLQIWKQVNKKGSIRIFGIQMQENKESNIEQI